MDMAGYRIVRISESLLSPYLPIYLVIGKDTPLICHEQAEKIIFLCRQANLQLITIYLSVSRINF